MEGGPDVTVVVPTFRRADALARLLTGLAAQRTQFSWDVVVVDNDLAGSARSVVASAGALPVRCLVEPRTGAAHARNRGLASAAGDIVAMLDDDVVPGTGWLATLVEPIRAGRADVCGGPVRLDPAVPRPRWFDETGIGGYLTAVDLGATERDVAADEVVVTANLAVRAGFVRQVRFDPTFGPRGRRQLVGDDVQLVRDLRAAGARVRWVPGAAVVHELPAHRLTRRYLLRRAWEQGRTDWLLDREQLRRRRLRGTRVPVSWLAGQLRRRGTEGAYRREVAFHAGCDLVRAAGQLFAAWTDGAADVPEPR